VGNNISTSTSTKARKYQGTSVRRAAAAASEGGKLQMQRYKRHLVTVNSMATTTAIRHSQPASTVLTQHIS